MGVRRSHRGDRTERGAALVEIVMVLPVLLVLMLGIVTGGLALNRSNSLNNAAREAARFGATLDASDLSAWTKSVAAVAESAAGGELAVNERGRYICVALLEPGNSRRLEIDESGATTVVSDGSGCFDDGRPAAEERVQVLVEREANLNMVFYSFDVTVDGRSVSKFERS